MWYKLSSLAMSYVMKKGKNMSAIIMSVVLVLILGILAYSYIPKAKDPNIKTLTNELTQIKRDIAVKEIIAEDIKFSNGRAVEAIKHINRERQLKQDRYRRINNENLPEDNGIHTLHFHD